MKRASLLFTLAPIVCPTYSFVVPFHNRKIKHQKTFPLAGLLDEYLDDGTTTEEPTKTNDTSVSSQYEDLFHSLIFSGDTRTDIAMNIEECTDSKFAEYLQTTLKQSQDEDEKQGLQDLMDLIAQVVEEVNLLEQQKQEELDSKEAAKAQREKELIEEAHQKASKVDQSKMSNADVVKQANNIDEAVMTNVISDDEKPSDFISDCREVVNLSGGFNNKGRMRVGG